MNKVELLNHHIYFLSTHRGKRFKSSSIDFIHSDKPAFNIAFPTSGKHLNSLSSKFSIYLPDWIDVKNKSILNRTKTSGITYMLLSDDSIILRESSDVIIKEASTYNELEEFSMVQGKGFCETEEDFNEWFPWMRAKNLQNFEAENQQFLIAYQNEIPVGVCLTIFQKDILGIYAVTTLPNQRKKGISTTLMKHIIESNKTFPITLQVVTNSYAHSFYNRTGFTDVFECSVLTSK